MLQNVKKCLIFINIFKENYLLCRYTACNVLIKGNSIMGMSAGQARLLSVTARLTDNELRSQMLTNSKLRLADKSTEASNKYMDALNSQQLMYTSYDGSGNKISQALTANTILSFADMKNQYAMVNTSGQVLVSGTDIKNFESSETMNDFISKYLPGEVNPDWTDALKDIYGNYWGDLYDEENPEQWITYFTGLISTDTDNNGTPDIEDAINNLNVEKLQDLVTVDKASGTVTYNEENTVFADITAIINNWENSFENDSNISDYADPELAGTFGEYVKELLGGFSASLGSNGGELKSIIEDMPLMSDADFQIPGGLHSGLDTILNNGCSFHIFSTTGAGDGDQAASCAMYLLGSLLFDDVTKDNVGNIYSTGVKDANGDDISFEIVLQNYGQTLGISYPDELNYTGGPKQLYNIDTHSTHAGTDVHGNACVKELRELLANGAGDSPYLVADKIDSVTVTKTDGVTKVTVDSIAELTELWETVGTNPIEINETEYKEALKKVLNSGVLLPISVDDSSGKVTYIIEPDNGIITTDPDKEQKEKENLQTLLLSRYKWVTCEDGKNVLKPKTIQEYLAGLFYYAMDIYNADAAATSPNLGLSLTDLIPYVQEMLGEGGDIDNYTHEEDAVDTEKYNEALAAWAEQIKAYLNDWLDNVKALQETYEESLEDIPVKTILNENDSKYRWYKNLWYRMGGITETSKDESGKNYKELDPNLLNNSEWLEFALEHGIITLEQAQYSEKGSAVYKNMGTYDWTSIIYSNASDIVSVEDEAAIARAEVEYENAVREIENEDKKIDQDLKKLDTEHSALQTEYDSIKSVIDKNVERSFKAFS